MSIPRNAGNPAALSPANAKSHIPRSCRICRIYVQGPVFPEPLKGEGWGGGEIVCIYLIFLSAEYEPTLTLPRRERQRLNDPGLSSISPCQQSCGQLTLTAATTLGVCPRPALSVRRATHEIYGRRGGHRRRRDGVQHPIQPGQAGHYQHRSPGEGDTQRRVHRSQPVHLPHALLQPGHRHHGVGEPEGLHRFR